MPERGTFDSPLSLLAWLRDETHNMSVFLKDHPPTAYVRDVLADRRFLAEARHAFLIRRPEEIAASNYSLHPGMSITAIGLERLCEVQAVSPATGLRRSFHGVNVRHQPTLRATVRVVRKSV